MSLRNINKIIAFVILIITSSILLQCSGVLSRNGQGPEFDAVSSGFEEPESIATIRSEEVTESSGLAVSRCQTDVFWTHNDSGDGPYIYAFNSSGRHLGTWDVTGARNLDWEDIATMRNARGECYLYIGEIGNNERKRPTAAVYKVREPMITDGSKDSDRKNALSTEPAAALRFTYPSPQDAEALFVHPLNETIYVITKHFSGAADVYEIAPRFGSAEIQKVEAIGKILLPAVPQGLVTGADVSPNGRHVVITDYYAAYELSLGNPSVEFVQVWKQVPIPINIGQRAIGEAIAYSPDGNSLFATSERRSSPLIRIRRKAK